MFTSAAQSTAINTITAREGSFKISPGVQPDIDIVMVYSNRETGTTFGSCPIHTLRLSEKTMSAFKDFIESAEADFGNLILEGGFIAEAEGKSSSMGEAESPTGLRPRGLGGV